jgi:hypothetical protein
MRTLSENKFFCHGGSEGEEVIAMEKKQSSSRGCHVMLCVPCSQQGRLVPGRLSQEFRSRFRNLGIAGAQEGVDWRIGEGFGRPSTQTTMDTALECGWTWDRGGRLMAKVSHE